MLYQTQARSDQDAPAARAHVLESVRRDQVELIRFLWVDHNGITRGKAVSAGALAERMISGVGLAKTRQAASLSDIGQPAPGYDAVGEVRLLPDPRSYVLLPHAPGAAAMLCDLVTVEGAPWAGCPRTFLREAMVSAGKLEVAAAFEPEFTLCSGPPRPDGLEFHDSSLCFDNEGFDAANDFAIELARTLTSQGIPVQTYHPEFAPGQHEMTVRHTTALRAADQFVWQRLLTRGLARRHGMWATFAPVPAPGLRGNGNHVHISVWQGESAGDSVNLFADSSDVLGLSALARHFIAGLLAHLPGLTALTCASVNSYDRLRPGMWSGAYLGYGLDNREAAIRIPSRLRGAEAASTNVEVKSCDATANPYLALGALILAGLDGVRRRLDPGEPLDADPHLACSGVPAVPRLPACLADAVDALERDDFLMEILGPERRLLYPAIKRADIHDMERLGTELTYYQHAIHF